MPSGKQSQLSPTLTYSTITKKTLRKFSQYEDPLISATYADVQTRRKELKHLEKMVKTLDSID